MPICIDADASNADWPKRTWDVWDLDTGERVTTLAQARKVLHYRTVAEYKLLLHNRGLPPTLRLEIEAMKGLP